MFEYERTDSDGNAHFKSERIKTKANFSFVTKMLYKRKEVDSYEEYQKAFLDGLDWIWERSNKKTWKANISRALIGRPTCKTTKEET